MRTDWSRLREIMSRRHGITHAASKPAPVYVLVRRRIGERSRSRSCEHCWAPG